MKDSFTEIINLTIAALILLIVLSTCEDSHAKTRIAVIDTGFDSKYTGKVNLCSSGHKDFTGTGIQDTHGHGTHVAGLIAQNALDYCLVIIKFYDKNSNSFKSSISALKWAIAQDVDIINYSAGGTEPNELERKYVVQALDKGILVVAAAGNEASNLAVTAYYPAAYDRRAIVVGNLTESGTRAPTSNYDGPVDLMVIGTNRKSLNGTMSGTSQSTAIVTGVIAQQIYKRKLSKRYDIFK